MLPVFDPPTLKREGGLIYFFYSKQGGFLKRGGGGGGLKRGFMVHVVQNTTQVQDTHSL